MGIARLHHRFLASARHHHSTLLLEAHPPNRLARLTQLTHQLSRLEIPHLDTAVAAAAHDPILIKLQRRDGVVVGSEAMDSMELGERPDADGAVGAASDKHVAAHLQLADEGGVALQHGEAAAVSRVPHAHRRVQAAGHDAPAVERHRVDLAEVPVQHPHALALRDAPDARRRVVRPRHDQVAAHLHAPHRRRVPHQHVLADALRDVPDAQRGVARPGHGGRRVRHLQAAHGGGVAAQHVRRCASRHVPHADVAVAAAGDEHVVPGHHGPHAHHVALQRLLVVALGVEHVDLRIVQRHHDVLLRQVQARHHALVRRDLLLVHLAARPPRRLHHVPLLEVAAVRDRFRPAALLRPRLRHAVEALRPEIGCAGAGPVAVPPVERRVPGVGRCAGSVDGVGRWCALRRPPVAFLLAQALPRFVVRHELVPTLGDL